MSARLCVERPPTRTLGDDLESFALLLLWLAGKYAENDMSPIERAEFLQRFDSLYGRAKADMFGVGSTIAVRLKLSSKNLKYLLARLLEGYRYRYTELLEQEEEMPHELAAHEGALAARIEQRQARLENHEWLMSLLSESLKNGEWKKDDSSKDQEVAPLNQGEGGTKRKSAFSEYELTNASKRLRLAEYNGTEEDDEEDVDTEYYEDVGERGVEGDGDEQNDDDGDDDEVLAKED